MEHLNGILRESWSRAWPGLALGVFSAIALLLLMGLAALMGRHLDLAHMTLLFPLYPILPGLTLLAAACTGPLLFARTRKPFMARLAERCTPFLVACAGFAFGFYCVICLLPLFTAYLDEFLPHAGASLLLLLLYSGADAAVRRMRAGAGPHPAARVCLVLACLGSLAVLVFLCKLFFRF